MTLSKNFGLLPCGIKIFGSMNLCTVAVKSSIQDNIYNFQTKLYFIDSSLSINKFAYKLSINFIRLVKKAKKKVLCA